MPKRLGKRSSDIFERGQMADYQGEVATQATYTIWARHQDNLGMVAQKAKTESGWRRVNQSMLLRQIMSIFLDKLSEIDWSKIDSERSVRETIEAQIVRDFCGE